jgi:predicted component of type VI protein secretion system
MAGTNYQLTIQVGPDSGKVYVLDKPEMVIGRDLTVDIVISDSEISRKHAHLIQQPGGYAIEDLGSTNGTVVNGERLDAPHLLKSGEVITLGENISLLYEAPLGDPDATRPAANTYAPRAPATMVDAPVSNVPPGYIPEVPDFAGQIPEQPVQVQPEPVKKRFPTWAIIAIVAVLVLICACAAILEIIDANNLWCTLFPFIQGCP